MQKLRGRFDHIWSEMEYIFESNGSNRPKRIYTDSMNGKERKYSYKRMFCEIIDVVCRILSVRLSENAKLLWWVFSMPDIFSLKNLISWKSMFMLKWNLLYTFLTLLL
jgi:hypothetical protein